MDKLLVTLTRDETATIATALRTLAWHQHTDAALVRECEALAIRIEGPLPVAPDPTIEQRRASWRRHMTEIRTGES